MIVRVSLLLVSFFLISTMANISAPSTAIAETATQTRLDKYVGAGCDKALTELLLATKSVEKKAESPMEMKKLYSKDPVEKRAMTKILERGKSSDPYESLAVKTYLRFSALGADLKPSAFLDDLEHGDAKRLGALHIMALEEMTKLKEMNPNVSEKEIAKVAFAVAFANMGVGSAIVDVGSTSSQMRPVVDMFSSPVDEELVVEPPQISSGREAILDPTRRSVEALEFEEAMKKRIVGQDEGVKAVVDLYQVFKAGLSSAGRPVGNLLFLGPTGTGKTRVVEAAAEILFGDSRALIKVDCAEFQQSHEIAKLIGSPPGYLGHRETHPLITQEALAQYHNEDLKLSFILFDEIEKASDSLWQLLLGILDKATLTLGDNRRVDLSQTMIFLTSNLGGGDITNIVSNEGGMGFAPPPHKQTADERVAEDSKVKNTATGAAKAKFSAEFMNRIDKIVVFRPLRREQLEQILEIELGMVQERVLDTGRGQFLFRVDQPARDFLLKEGTDIKYGARHLKRAIEKYLVYPLANLLSTDQIKFGDAIVVGYEGGKDLTFKREGTGAVVPAPVKSAKAKALKQAAETGGKVIGVKLSKGLAEGAPIPRDPRETEN